MEKLSTSTGKYGDEVITVLSSLEKFEQALNQSKSEGVPDHHFSEEALDMILQCSLQDMCTTLKRHLFLQRYQTQPVWRADRPQRGRYREFYQRDVDSWHNFFKC